ncbi:RNA-directed DNA polymerase, eukaryota, reverse transcriptase zinc-binding domain protein [Tanacetum coccineum]|uniref:RNA-directed DNA polymerase, eukaryota, reverse transcriptase zinc-binding domain protein n=1 Tax=Tanacetum coccineum TaxID=301880 RepID=A0ABQ5DMV9_9ASTR
MDRELVARLAVCEIQKRNEDLKILTFDTTEMAPEDATKIEALKEKTLNEEEKKASDSDVSIPPGFESLVKRDEYSNSSPRSKGGSKMRKKRVWIKELCFKHNVHFLGVQESKMTKLELFQLKSMWGNFNFDYACSMTMGRSGGIITMWDPNVFKKNIIWCNDNYVIVEGKWKNSVEDYFLINVYGPQQQPEKYILWDLLRSFIQNHQENFILFGDLNEVRCATERFGSNFSSSDATIFNAFIQDVGLIDLPMGGKISHG